MDYAQLKKEMEKQHFEMTISERLKAYNAGEETDCILYNIHTPDDCFADLYGFTTSALAKDVDVKSEVIRRKTRDFGLDSYNVGLGLKGIGASLGSVVVAPVNGFEDITSYVLADYSKLDSMEPADPRNNPVLTPILEQAKILRDRFPDMTLTTSVSGPITTAISLRPIEFVLRDTIKRPEKLEQMLDLAVDSALAWIQAFHDEVGTVITTFSDPVTSSAIFSKKQFDHFSFPYIKRLVEGMTRIMGATPSVHVCGRSREIWQDMASLNLEFFSVDDREDVAVMKAEVGDKIRISGNVPPVDVMRNGTIDDVIRACRECLEKASDSPKGYILNTGCEPPLGTPRENLDAYIYAVRKYGRGAKIGQKPAGLYDD